MKLNPFDGDVCAVWRKEAPWEIREKSSPSKFLEIHRYFMGTKVQSQLLRAGFRIIFLSAARLFPLRSGLAPLKGARQALKSMEINKISGLGYWKDRACGITGR
ncbi:MAG: hypothetical protein HY579_03070 [Nitrospinae bacterium]|nr:hypothetical protein [Nitrospinota bacterium]